ncbi:MAG: hypothetical protein MK077_07050 [Phycisphaerales bacterium]|nr:hypothetical protein [Phycisphaerales bacterium]
MSILSTIIVGALATPANFLAAPLSLGQAQASGVAPVDQAVAPMGQSQGMASSASVQAGWVWQLKTSLTDGAGGRFSMNRGHVNASAQLALASDLDLLIGGRYQRDNYSWEDIASPWTSTNTTRFEASLKWKASRQLQVFGGGMARWAAESGASLSDGFSGGGAIGAAWAFSKELVLGGGVGIRSRILDDPLWFPIVVVEWQITERLRLSSRLTSGWANRSGAELIYELSDNLDVGVAAVYDYQRFRLSDDAPISGGAGTSETLPVAAFISYNVSERFSLTAFAGATVYGRLTGTTQARNETFASDFDPAPVLGIQGTIRF